MSDTYYTIEGAYWAELPKVKGSRFIGEAFAVETTEAVETYLAQIRKREYNATHWCWAYRIGGEGEKMRFNDDGEPSGTAGQPILRQIEGRKLTNILVVVTRYYGGTKLGTGGLIRAYGDAAAYVLDTVDVLTRIKRQTVSLRFAYFDTSAAMHTLQRFDALMLHTDYGDDTTLHVAVRQSQVADLEKAFVEALHGRGKVI